MARLRSANKHALTAVEAANLGGQPPVHYAEDADTGFAIIYPNGGTEAAPATVSSDSRYVEPNPFPGYQVMCEVEVKLGDDRWGKPGWDNASSSTQMSRGARAGQHDAGDIVVQTGLLDVLGTAVLSGGTRGNSSIYDNLPCRVLVWKVKGAI